MVIVSNKEFVTNQEFFFDLVLNEQVIIRKKKYKKPDDDLRRAITGDELLVGIFEDLEIFFADK